MSAEFRYHFSICEDCHMIVLIFVKLVIYCILSVLRLFLNILLSGNTRELFIVSGIL